MELPGLFLMMMLGLRHGFDPDHIAIIDGMGARYASSRPSLVKWTGTLFAIGHGTVVTGVTIMISRFSHAFTFPKAVWSVLDWTPGILLLVVGLLNLRNLQGSAHFHPKGWKLFFLPKRLKDSSHPLAIVLMGMAFAFVFDTNTQAAAWAYTATSQLTPFNAAILGIAFSVGMITTDTLDSRILYRLMLRSGNGVYNYRRGLGWIIVAVSLAVGSYKIATLLFPALHLPDAALTGIGISFFLLMAGFYAFTLYQRPQLAKE